MFDKLSKLRNNQDTKTVFTNFIYLVVLKGGNFIFPLIYLPYLLNVLGVSNFGLVSFVESIMLYFKAVTDYGFDLTGTRDIAKNKENEVYVSKKIANILVIKLILLLVCLAILLVLNSFIPEMKEEQWLYFFSFISVIGYSMLPTWYYQGIEKMKYITLLFFIARMLSTLSLFIFVRQEQDYVWVPLLNGIGYIIAGILGLWLMLNANTIKLSYLSIKSVWIEMMQGFNVFVSTLAPNLYNNSMTFLLGIFSSTLYVGYYAAAVKLVDVANSLVMILSNAIFPYLNRDLSHHKKIQYLFLIPSAILSVILLLGSEILIELISKEDIAESIKVLKIIAISPFLLACMSCYGTNFLLVISQDRLVKNITLVGSFLGFIMALILIPKHFHIGAAVTLVSVRGLLATCNWVEYLKFKSPKSSKLISNK